MKISEEGLDIIRRYEGLRLKAYRCPAGIWTIGFGSTGPDVHEGMTIDEDEANLRLLKDVRKAENCVSRGVSVPLNQNQYDALVSLSFNIGCEAFWRSTLRAYVNRKAWENAAREFGRWNKSRGKELPGLTVRRKEEAALFMKGTPA